MDKKAKRKLIIILNIIVHPTYFPSIAHFVVMAKASKVVFEVKDNYQKQTYRNRSYIYGANGRLLLNVPVKHSHKNRQKYKEIRIANEEDWQSLNWKSIQSAYRSSPFFEFYEAEFLPLFEKKYKFLLDHNFECLQLLLNCLEMDLNYSTTSNITEDIPSPIDYRLLTNARKETTFKFEEYTQVFMGKFGFMNNLSILDLLFNEGTSALSYLQSQEIKII